MHFIFIILIIVIIVAWQVKIYLDTRGKLLIYRNAFPPDSQDYWLQKNKIETIKKGDWNVHKEMLADIGKDINNYVFSEESDVGTSVLTYRRDYVIKLLIEKLIEKGEQIFSKHKNPIFIDIITSINDYLSVNKSGVSDFHLMKDIVDRNCEMHEEEINTQIPIPLYLGLMGTMAGILIGIAYLWLSGGLNELLNSGSHSLGADGVEALLGGVALAMTASITGIILTTYGSMSTKDAKARLEKSKHTFLSWIQAKLLPNLTNDVASTLEKMSQNLVAFNKTFSTNTTELGKTLSQVKETSQMQAQLLNTVKQISDKDISQKNFELYNTLKKSTNEIGQLASYLNHVNEYLANVKALKEKLDASEQHTKTIEEIAVFFKTEIQQVEARIGVLSKALGTVDGALEEAIRKLKDNAETKLEELKKTTSKQHDFLQQNSLQINNLVAELNNLTAVKESILKFEQAARNQNSKLDNLAASIQALAKARAEGTTFTAKKATTPLTMKIFMITGFSRGALALLFLIIANNDRIYNIIYDLFRI